MQAFLVYCKENEQFAKQFAEDIQRSTINFVLDDRDLEERNVHQEAIINSSAPIFLLISDNFLRSEDCMYNAILFLQDAKLKSRVNTIVIDGIKTNESGTVENVPTKFQRVSNVIHYMNHWQDIYLELRRQKRENDYEKEDAFNQKINNVRSISSEIGEFLRLLKSKEYYEFKKLRANKFKLLFQLLNKEQLHSSYKNLAIVNYNIEDVSAKSNQPIRNKIVEEKSTTLEYQAEPVSVEPVLSVNGSDKILTNIQKSIEDKVPPPPPPIVKEEIESKKVIEEVVKPEESKKPETLLEKLVRSKNNDDDKSIEEKVIADTPKKPETILEKLARAKKEKGITEEVVEDIELKKEELTLDEAGIVPQTVEEVIEEESIVNDVQEKSEEIQTNAIAPEQKEEDFSEKSSIEILRSLFEEDKDVDKAEEKLANRIDPIIEKEEMEEELELMAEKIVNKHENEEKEIIEETTEEVVENIEKTESSEVVEEEQVEKESIVQVIKEVKQDEPESVVRLLSTTEISKLIEEERYIAALEGLEYLTEKEPSNLDAQYQLAVFHITHLDNIKEGRKALKKILNKDNTYVDAHLLLAELAETQGDFLLAKTHFENVFKLNSNTPGLAFKLGMLLSHNFKGYKKKAADYFKFAIGQDEDNPDAHYQYGVLLYEHFGKNKKALKHLKKVAQLQEDHPFTHYDMAVAYYEMGKPKLAAECYIKATQTNPELKTKQNDLAFKIEKYKAIFKKEAEEKAAKETALKELELAKSTSDEALEEKIVTIIEKLSTTIITGSKSKEEKGLVFKILKDDTEVAMDEVQKTKLKIIQNNLQEILGMEATNLMLMITGKEEIRKG